MERLKREPQQKKAPLPESTKKVFTGAEIKHSGDFAKQAELIVSAHKPAGLPESVQPLLMAGDPNSFREFIRRQQRIEREEKERQKQDQQKREENKRAEQARLEQKREYERSVGVESYRKLEQELVNLQPSIFQAAEDIKREIWTLGLKQFFTTISIEKVSIPEVKLNDDYTIQSDYSRTGIELSYKKTESGHFMPPEAKYGGARAYRDRKKYGIYFGLRRNYNGANGAKEYFIETYDFTYSEFRGWEGEEYDRQKHPDITTYPLSNPNAFHEALYNKAKKMKP